MPCGTIVLAYVQKQPDIPKNVPRSHHHVLESEGQSRGESGNVSVAVRASGPSKADVLEIEMASVGRDGIDTGLNRVDPVAIEMDEACCGKQMPQSQGLLFVREGLCAP